MKFEPRAKGVIAKSGLSVEKVQQVLERIESFMPHLYFGKWGSVSLPDHAESNGHVALKQKNEVEVSVFIKEAVKLSTRCKRHTGPTKANDREFLRELASEAAEILGSASKTPIPISEFGIHSVSQIIKDEAAIAGDVYSTLSFLRSLVSETYENQRITYGIIVSNKVVGTEKFSLAVNSKRMRRLTDGFATAIVLDEDQQIYGYEPIDIPQNEGVSLRCCPRWCSALATASASHDYQGVGIALGRSGDIVVLNRGQLFFSQRAGRWQIWNHTAIIGRLRSEWSLRSSRKDNRCVLRSLYHVALDLSFKRSGGLLVVLFDRRDLNSLLTSRTDAVGATHRSDAERAIDSFIEGKRLRALDRRLLTDIASFDGALVVDIEGRVLAYGAMTRSSGNGSHQGARTKAAIGASRKGLAIKISSDGEITMYSDAKAFMEL